jgi:hypothetical protein
MAVTLQAPPGDLDPPTPVADPDDAARALKDGMSALEATAVRLAGERDMALARTRRAEADAAGLLRVNLALQRQLDAHEETIADLRAQNTRLAGQIPAADGTPRHGRWRR